MEQTTAAEINQLVERLRKLFPGKHVTLTVYGETGSVEFSVFNPGKYKDAEEILRNFGVSKRDKKPYDSYTALKGIGHFGIKFTAFPDELPPTCRKETYIERIPKTQTIETDEFIEVERTRIVCSGEKKKNIA